uniref:aminotransferase class V-fold PLP-dependent enzyme n=1 Tax=Roseivirga sp. TaxID=1964215 RepID=UPI00404771B7
MLTAQDIHRFRLDTPGTQHVIHFNNAGSSLPPEVVRKAVNDYNNEEMTLGGYETNQKYLPELEATYDSIATLLNANRDEIAVVENATAAWNAAFQAIDWKDGDVIIATRADYASNYLAYLHLKRKYDIEIKIMPTLPFGDPDLVVFDHMIDS